MSPSGGRPVPTTLTKNHLTQRPWMAGTGCPPYRCYAFAKLHNAFNTSSGASDNIV